MRYQWSCLPSPWSGYSLVMFSERSLSYFLPSCPSVPGTDPPETPFLPTLLDTVKD